MSFIKKLYTGREYSRATSRLNLAPVIRECKKSFVALALIIAILPLGQAHAKKLSFSAKSKAIRAIEKQKWLQAENLMRGAEDDALKIVYQWRYYQHGPNYKKYKISFSEVSSFVYKHAHWPNVKSMRPLVEETIVSSDTPNKVIEWFAKYPPVTANGVRKYAENLLKTNQRDEFKSMINNWWATTLMSRADQRFVYSLYGRHITKTSHLKRMNKLLLNRSYTNARAVAKLLGGGIPQLVEARIALIAQKHGVDKKIAAVPVALKNDSGLQFDRLRWRRKKNLDDRAIDILNNPPHPSEISNLSDWWGERHIIIRRLLEDKQYKRAAKLALNHQQQEGFPYAQAEWLAGWLALKYLNDPTQAFQRFQRLGTKVKTPISQARAFYWTGRAAEKIGDGSMAKLWYDKAAQFQTTYYGQKAGDKVGRDIALKYMKAPKVTIADEIAYLKKDLIAAAWLYRNAGFDDISSDMLWSFANNEQTAKAYIFAIKQAQRMKRNSDVVKLSKRASQKGVFVTKYAYPTLGEMAANIHDGVAPSFAHAIIRQESQFNPKARSPVGAMGLMQLMPSTARQVAKSNNLRYRTSWLASKPAYNVKIGSAFLFDLLKRYEGDTALVSAAYNAGPSRVNKWLKLFGDPRRGDISHIDWVELIPFYETRNYVQRVDEALNVYSHMLFQQNLQ